MKINLRFNFKDFAYTSPIAVRNKTLTTNQMLSVEIFHNDQLINKIELCSLPFFHNYNLREWKCVLEDFFSEHELNFSQIKLDHPFFNTTVSTLQHEGELLFVIESILFAVIEKLFPESLSHIEKKPIKLNALYSHFLAIEEIPDCLKIKIRPVTSNMIETANLIHDLREKNANIIFRLDGNGSFELSELEVFLDYLAVNCGSLEQFIEYIEEPFKNINDLTSFRKMCSIPIALDESLLPYRNSLFLLPKKTYLIVKPSLLGISKSFEIMKMYKEKMIISSSFETASALRPLMFLAAMNPKTYHGLDTLKFLPKELSMQCEKYFLSF